MRKLVWIAVSLCAWMLSTIVAHAQQFSMQAYGRKSGLESQTVNVMFQDTRGFVWAGTEMGLYRFNGSSFERMQREEGFATGEFVNAITEDHLGQLWVATQSGLRVGDSMHFQAVNVAGRPIITDAGRRIAALEDGRLLLIHNNRVEVLSKDARDNWKIAPLFDQATTLAHPELTTITAIRAIRGHVWLGCARSVCDANVDGSVRVLGDADGVPSDVWSGFNLDSTGTLWLRGTHFIRARTANAKLFESRDIPGAEMDVLTDDMGVAEDPQGRILTRTNNGLALWHDGRWKVFKPSNGLPDVGITALLFDRDGDLWLGTYGRGVYLWNGYGDMEGWSSSQGMDTVPGWSLLRDDKGRMWFGNELGGELLDPGATRLRPWPATVTPPPRQNLSMQKAADGAIWIGDYDGRILRSDPRTGDIAVVAKLPVFIKAIHFDRQGKLWIATTQGVYAIDQEGEPAHTFPQEQMPPSPCSDIAEGNDGTLWFACNAGLLRYANGKGMLLRPYGAAVPGGFIAVATDKSGDLWLGANEPGLFRAHVQGDMLDVQRITDRWLDNTLAYFIRHDRRGWLWVGGGAGVDVYDGNRWVHLSQDSGLLWDETGENAFFEDNDGSIWIGTAIGASHILHPESVFRPRQHTVLITGVTHGDTQLRNGTTVAMDTQVAPLRFRFARMGSAAGGTPHYRYRLTGTQAGWVDTAANEVNVAALPAGDYRFEIQAIDDDQRAFSPGATFDFSVLPPWWWRWWSILAMVVVVAALFALAWRWRTRALTVQNRRLDVTVQQRTAELQREKSELEGARAELYVQATFDELTGLLNRRAILEKLEYALASPNNRRKGFALALVDLDHFKRVNDTYGHQAGDAVLRTVALRLATHLRSSDMLGRYGGEELLMMMENIDEANATRRLETLRKEAGSSTHVWGEADFNVTLSVGLAWIGTETISMHDLILRADQALYAAKQGGRDRVVVAGQEA
ncbi:diguanylate cyclase [Rhodanobacter sp. L36]|uniref:ligand-binding sensor domain-containing diguanylate cyclase n=1 Tax=Rhodanobacter sp. L36 TaxID=1747221 RepID=UPI00131C6DBB|nr:diguanylate cyclase [Rhodanobacter sp. L36]